MIKYYDIMILSTIILIINKLRHIFQKKSFSFKSQLLKKIHTHIYIFNFIFSLIYV